ncbi:MAG: M1 family metallopeptidase [Promethearchaeota archaeon]
MNARGKVYPINYLIRLELDVNSEKFSGYTQISLKSEENIQSVILNCDSLNIKECLIEENGMFKNCNFDVNNEKLEMKILLSEHASDSILLKVIHEGRFHADLLGLYRSKYEFDNKVNYVIASQLEEIYARRVFPCIDHPSMKAIFNVEFIIDDDLIGISNTSIKEELKIGDGKKLIKFESTPKMSTYLLFFGVGKFEIKEKKTSNYIVRLVTTPGKTIYGNLGIDMAIKSLDYCEKFTSLKYPISKCDLIAVPDFPFGAMENYGAITFRENLLLVYPDLTSQLDKFHVGSVIAHEVSHFWFGDLVSPIDWKYIWLNESFASYFTYAIPDQYFPEWHSWDHFIVQYYTNALNRDGLINTFPVELTEEEEIFITPAKVGIVYNKGASILRMLVGYLGEQDFKKGIAHFLNIYKYDCANTEQYWNAFEDSTGKEVKNFASSWVNQPGYPIIQVSRDGDKLNIIQNRFTYLPYESELNWLIHCNIELFKKDGNSIFIEIIFDQKNYEINMPPDIATFKLNAGQKGFYRIKYEPKELKKLGELILDKTLSPVDRYGIQNDLYALVKCGEIKLDRYLEFISDYYTEEDDYLPMVDLLSNLMNSYLLAESKRELISKIGIQITEKILERIELEPQENEKIPTSILRNSLLWVGFSLGSKSIAEFGLKKFEDYFSGKKVHQDLISSILKIGANLHGGAMDLFKKKIKSGELPQIEKLYIYEAMGCIKNEQIIPDILDITLKDIPPQTWNTVFYRIGSNLKALEKIWPWFKKNISTIEKGGLFVMGRSISSLIPLGGLKYKIEVEMFLRDFGEKNEFQKDTIEMTLEQLEINFNFQSKNSI